LSKSKIIITKNKITYNFNSNIHLDYFNNNQQYIIQSQTSPKKSTDLGNIYPFNSENKRYYSAELKSDLNEDYNYSKPVYILSPQYYSNQTPIVINNQNLINQPNIKVNDYNYKITSNLNNVSNINKSNNTKHNNINNLKNQIYLNLNKKYDNNNTLNKIPGINSNSFSHNNQLNNQKSNQKAIII